MGKGGATKKEGGGKLCFTPRKKGVERVLAMMKGRGAQPLKGNFNAGAWNLKTWVPYDQYIFIGFDFVYCMSIQWAHFLIAWPKGKITDTICFLWHDSLCVCTVLETGLSVCFVAYHWFYCLTNFFTFLYRVLTVSIIIMIPLVIKRSIRLIMIEERWLGRAKLFAPPPRPVPLLQCKNYPSAWLKKICPPPSLFVGVKLHSPPPVL